jgi:sulfate adenylyltransferase
VTDDRPDGALRETDTSAPTDPPQPAPETTLHGDDLAWLELMLIGALPRRYDRADAVPRARDAEPAPRGARLVVDTATAAAAETAGEIVLLDPEGVRLATVAVDTTVALGDGAAVLGVPRGLTAIEHHDHTALRATPDAVAASWNPGPAVALWADTPPTLTVREKAREHARSLGRPVLEVVPVPGGRETDRAPHLAARLAQRETTRDDGDRAVLVPDPGLTWTAADLLTRAAIVAEHGAATLLVPPGRLRNLGAAREGVGAAAAALGVTLEEVAAHPGETRLDPRVLDRMVLQDEPFPDWFAEAPVGDELRRLHRPKQRAGFTVLLSGLSGSGKSTVARRLSVRLLEEDSRSVSLLDGDVVRHHLSQGLGFSRADRDINVRRIGYVASEITKAGGIAIACPIAPYDATRRDVRAMVEAQGGFVLVHVATPLAECERRDRKGLYARARRGEIPEFTGISDPYEEPTDAEVVVDTTDVTVDHAVDVVMSRLRELGHVPGDPSSLYPGLPAFASPRG